MARTATIAMLMTSRRVAVFTAALSLLCLLAEAAYCWRTPTAYFDTMAYAAMADGSGHRFETVAAECAEQVPDKRDSCGMVAGSAMFGQAAAYSDGKFAQSLRFYTVKPLYVGLDAGMHRWLGAGSFVGLRVISVASFLVIGMVSWAWLREHLPVAVAPIAALWMTAMGPVLGLGKGLLPDGMSTALVLLAVYLLLYRGARWLGAGVMALAVLTRPDNMLLVMCLGCVWVWRREVEARRRWLSVGGVVLGCAAVSWVLGKMTGALGWAVLFRRSFFEMIPPERFATAHVTLGEYSRVMASNGVRTVIFCLPVALLLATLVMMGRRVETLQRLVLASMAAVVLRVVLYPGVEERYYVWFLLVCALAAACVVAESAKGLSAACTMVQDRELGGRDE